MAKMKTAKENFQEHIQGFSSSILAKTWKEVDGESVRDCREKMYLLDITEIEAGARYYTDQWTWIDSNEQNRILMEAFQEEIIAAHNKTRLVDVLRKYNNQALVNTNIFAGDFLC